MFQYRFYQHPPGLRDAGIYTAQRGDRTCGVRQTQLSFMEREADTLFCAGEDPKEELESSLSLSEGYDHTIR